MIYSANYPSNNMRSHTLLAGSRAKLKSGWQPLAAGYRTRTGCLWRNLQPYIISRKINETKSGSCGSTTRSTCVTSREMAPTELSVRYSQCIVKLWYYHTFHTYHTIYRHTYEIFVSFFDLWNLWMYWFSTITEVKQHWTRSVLRCIIE